MAEESEKRGKPPTNLKIYYKGQKKLEYCWKLPANLKIWKKMVEGTWVSGENHQLTLKFSINGAGIRLLGKTTTNLKI